MFSSNRNHNRLLSSRNRSNSDTHSSTKGKGRHHGLTGSAVGPRSITHGFESWLGYIRRVFHLSLRLVTFRGRPTKLAYLVHKSGRRTATFTSFFPEGNKTSHHRLRFKPAPFGTVLQCVPNR